VSRRPIRLEAFLGQEAPSYWLPGLAFVLLVVVVGFIGAGLAAGVAP
jgi:hypothetical protein